MKRTILSAMLVSLFIAGGANAADKAPLKSGIDLGNMDKAVRPQDDFFQYLNGHWLKTTEIPADKSAQSRAINSASNGALSVLKKTASGGSCSRWTAMSDR